MSATGLVYYGIVSDSLPERAWPLRSQLTADVRVNTRYVPSAENALQYEENEELGDEDEGLTLDDFANPVDYYEAVFRNMRDLFGLPLEGLELRDETDDVNPRWVLGRLIDQFSAGGREGEATPDSGVRAIYPLSLEKYARLEKEAQPYDMILRKWAEALGTHAPQIIFVVEA